MPRTGNPRKSPRPRTSGHPELLFRRALEVREKVLGQEHPDTATSLNNLAGLLQAQGKLTEAEPLFRRTLEIQEKALGPEHPNTTNTRNNLEFLLNAK
ncbi:tetratricopeptide repeat protein [Acidithiobacillus thiooxidans]|uniref:tetratricopeptide repeat protein n=1 Tax=Acidithiobacillus thiooxidans TaxID=930 RepID=UPI00190F315F